MLGLECVAALLVGEQGGLVLDVTSREPVAPFILFVNGLNCQILWHRDISLWAVLVMLCYKTIKFYRNFCGKIGFMTLLTHGCRYISDNQ